MQELGYKIVVIGEYSDNNQKSKLIAEGVEFWLPFFYDGKGNLSSRWAKINNWRSKIEKYLERQDLTNDDFVWIFQAETIAIFHNIVDKYKVIAHPLEFNNPHINWKFKFLYPNLKLDELFSKVYRVVCCEYNRAQIFKGMYGLENLPVVLPNKPYYETVEKGIQTIEDGYIKELIEEIKDKKVILYQGVFQDRERRLEEFCETIEMLPDEYALVAMGKGSTLFEELRKKYEGKRIKFVPFINPPQHLVITRLSYIGVLSYFPRKENIAGIINPLYCAPNKVFEYSMFGKPMISNDIPGLKYIFDKFNCGECVDYPMTPKRILEKIKKISTAYEAYSKGAIEYYNSINMKKIVKTILL